MVFIRFIHNRVDSSFLLMQLPGFYAETVLTLAVRSPSLFYPSDFTVKMIELRQ